MRPSRELYAHSFVAAGLAGMIAGLLPDWSWSWGVLLAIAVTLAVLAWWFDRGGL